MKIRNKDVMTIKGDRSEQLPEDAHTSIRSMFVKQGIEEPSQDKESQATFREVDQEKQTDTQSMLSLAKFHNIKASNLKLELAATM